MSFVVARDDNYGNWNLSAELSDEQAVLQYIQENSYGQTCLVFKPVDMKLVLNVRE